ncbi:hypothetical protein QTP70_003230, partial [Hemibagrus guttatus]
MHASVRTGPWRNGRQDCRGSCHGNASPACDSDASLPDALNSFYAQFEAQNDVTARKTIPLLEDQVLCLTTANVRKTLRRVNPRKAAGPDSIPGRVLRECVEQLADVFTDIFNIFLSSAIFSTCLKTTTIIPVPKKSPVSYLNDYRLLRKAHLPPPILTTESILSSCITAWFGNYTVLDRKTLQQIVRTAEKIIGVSLPSIMDIYSTHCICKANSIVDDPTQPTHTIFTLLPPGKRELSYACSSRVVLEDKKITPTKSYDSTSGLGMDKASDVMVMFTLGRLCEDMKTETSDGGTEGIVKKEEILELSSSNHGNDFNTPDDKISIKEEGADDKDFLYCEACQSFFFNKCEVHGPAVFIPDTPVPMGVTDRARRTLPSGLEIQKSGIPDAGLGVFNKGETVPVGAHFGPYQGELVDSEEAMNSGYSWV